MSTNIIPSFRQTTVFPRTLLNDVAPYFLLLLQPKRRPPNVACSLADSQVGLGDDATPTFDSCPWHEKTTKAIVHGGRVKLIQNIVYML